MPTSMTIDPFQTTIELKRDQSNSLETVDAHQHQPITSFESVRYNTKSKTTVTPLGFTTRDGSPMHR